MHSYMYIHTGTHIHINQFYFQLLSINFIHLYKRQLNVDYGCCLHFSPWYSHDWLRDSLIFWNCPHKNNEWPFSSLDKWESSFFFHIFSIFNTHMVNLYFLINSLTFLGFWGSIEWQHFRGTLYFDYFYFILVIHNYVKLNWMLYRFKLYWRSSPHSTFLSVYQ